MAERIVDAAVVDGPNTAVFFLTDQYVVYDFVADRVLDGVHPLGAFPPGSAAGFPAAFAPPGSSTSIDAALRGKRGFAGLRYFFSVGEYMRQQAGPPPVFDPSDALPLSLWQLPVDFAPLDAAFDGALNRDPFAYFFSGNRYLRYVWDAEQVDTGYPKPISNMIGMPTAFAAGVDAAVDGTGGFTDASYLFKNEQYVRFQWVDGAAEPHVEGGVRDIRDGWLGLEALLLAGKAKSSALEWVGVARAMLDTLATGVLGADDLALVTAALITHFHVGPGDNRVAQIRATFASVENTLRVSPTVFRFRDDTQAAGDGTSGATAAYTFPGAGDPNPHINFTNSFHLRPLLNRVSSVIHECVHVVDAASGTTDNHISEWYLTPAVAASFGLRFVDDDPTDFATRYDLMSADNAVHNPSAYATFARHAALRVDTRELP
jgi:hypothetical protein